MLFGDFCESHMFWASLALAVRILAEAEVAVMKALLVHCNLQMLQSLQISMRLVLLPTDGTTARARPFARQVHVVVEAASMLALFQAHYQPATQILLMVIQEFVPVSQMVRI